MIWYDNYEKLYYWLNYSNNESLINKATLELTDRNLNFIQLPLITKEGENFKLCGIDIIGQQVGIIERLYKEVEAEHKNYLVEESYHSCTIEGAVTTIADTLMVEENRSANSDSEKMVLNTINAIEYLDTGINDRITNENILKLWSIVIKDLEDTSNLNYRRENVRVGTLVDTIFEPPNYLKIYRMMDEFIAFYNYYSMHSIVKAIIIHFYLVYVHPFIDGNGRTARLLLSNYLIKNGFDKFRKISITSEIFKDLSEYYKSIKLCEDDNNDITFFVVYYLNKIESVLLRAKNNFKPYRDISKLDPAQLKIINWISKNKGRVTTVESFSLFASIDLDTSERLLDDLVNRGLLIKNENNIYLLNVYKGSSIKPINSFDK